MCQRPKERSHGSSRIGADNPCKGAEQRRLRDDEKAELICAWMQEELGGAEGRQAVVAEQREELLAREQERRAQDGAVQAEFRFPFGKKKGKTIAEVREESEDYIGWIIAGKTFFTAGLRQALEDDGTLQAELEHAKQLQLTKAESLVAKAPVGPEPPALEPSQKTRSVRERKRLRALELEEAHTLLSANAYPLIPPEAPPESRPVKQRAVRTREGASQQLQLVMNCLKCGSVGGHNQKTCDKVRMPVVLESEEQRQLEVARRRDRVKIALRAHLNYVKEKQRSSEYDTRPTQRKRCPADTTVKEMSRMGAFGFCTHLLGIELLQDLEGIPCPYLANETCVPCGWGTKSVSVLPPPCPSGLWQPLIRVTGGWTHKCDRPSHDLLRGGGRRGPDICHQRDRRERDRLWLIVQGCEENYGMGRHNVASGSGVRQA